MSSRETVQVMVLRLTSAGAPSAVADQSWVVLVRPSACIVDGTLWRGDSGAAARDRRRL